MITEEPILLDNLQVFTPMKIAEIRANKNPSRKKQDPVMKDGYEYVYNSRGKLVRLERFDPETMERQYDSICTTALPNGTARRGNHFEDYLASKILKDTAKERIDPFTGRQIGTILSLEDEFGTVENFFTRK